MTKYRFDEIAINSTQKKKPTEEDKVYYIGLEHIDPGCFDVVRWGSDVAPTGDKLLMQKGDVLFGKRRAYQRKVAIAPFDGIFSAHGMVLRPNLKVIDANYFPFFISSDKFMDTAVRISVGGLSPTINWKDLARQEFELPSLDEQKVLAYKLWAAYRLKEAYKKLLVATDEIVKSQFIEMFGTVENNTHNFPIMTIGEFAYCFAGATPSTSHPEYWENGRIRWMSSGEVHKGHVEDTDSRITELGYKSASTRMVPIHSIVIAIAGQGKTRGTVAITEVDLCTNQSLCAIVPDERVNYSYLYHNLQGRYLELRGLSGDVNGRGGLNLKIIQKIPVILPPIEKQQQFASIAQQADKSKFIEMFGDTHMRSDHSRQWKEVVEIINGKDYKSIQVEDGGYPVYGTGGEMARASDYLSPANSILLGRKGTIDKPLLIREKYWNVDTAFGAVPDEKVLHYVYFYWHCKTIDFNVLNKGTTLPSTTKVDLLNLWIKIPSMEEQTRFGSIVEQADKSKFGDFKSQFIEMFGNPLSSKQKNELKRLGQCCIINPRRPNIALCDTDKVSFIPMPAVSEDGYLVDMADEEYGKVKKGFTYFENNDVLFAKITPCMENGKGAIAYGLTNGIGVGSTEFHVLRPINGISSPYWLLTLTRMPIFRERAAKNMSGTGGQKRVSASYLNHFMVGLPAIEEQRRFEAIYKQADKSKFELRKSIDAIDKVIKSLINN